MKGWDDMKVTNPYFKQATSAAEEFSTTSFTRSDVATRTGITLKTLFCILAAIISGAVVAIFFNNTVNSVSMTDDQKVDAVVRMLGFLSVAAIVALISALIGRFFVGSAKIMTPVYSVCEGACIGILCAIGEVYVPGITVTAGVGTAVIFLATLGAYAFGLRKRIGTIYTFLLIFLVAAVVSSLSIFIFSLVNRGAEIPTGILIAVELIYLLYAIFCLMSNFAEADTLAESNAPKKYEWTVTLGLVISILYIFLELFRLILIIASSSSKN